MKRVKRILLRRPLITIVVLLFIGMQSFGQSMKVQGTVTNAQTGVPLPSASITVKGVTSGTSTDSDGNFQLEVPNSQSLLIISSVGYMQKEVPVNGRRVIAITLDPEVGKGLQEVVVIGYGTQSKSDLTGSVSSISSDQLEKSNMTTIDQGLQGKIAGVNVFRNSHEPGGGLSVSINGISSLTASGQPLYVIDGIPIATDFATGFGGPNTGRGNTMPSFLSSIEPGNIESMSILKGPSATAIYGSRGANGVVIITTKSGKAGQNRVDYAASVGVSKIAKKLDFMGAKDYAQMRVDNNALFGQPPIFTASEIESFGRGTDWQDEITRIGLTLNQSLSFSGGSEKTTYMIGGNYSRNEGIVRGSRFDRYGFTASVNSNISKRLKVGANTDFTYSINNRVPTGTKGYQEAPGIINNLITAPPTSPARNENGEIIEISSFPGGGQSPLVIAELLKFQMLTNRFIGNIHATYDITNDLSATVMFGGDVRNFRYGQYFPSNSGWGSGQKGAAWNWSDENLNIVSNNILNYRKEINADNRIDVTAGYTYQRQKNLSLQASSENFPTDNFLWNNLGSGSKPQPPSSYASEYTLISYLGRLNYSLLNRYLLTASIRTDGDSKFGANRKYGTFPSAAFAWQIGKENFMKNISAISQLKFRAEWGESGNESIGYYSSRSLINTSFDQNQAVIFGGGVLNPIAYPIGIANPDLSWEKTSGVVVGLDLGLFVNRLIVTSNIYFKKTNDLLLNVPIAQHSGYSSVLMNTGSMKNSGVELQIMSVNLRDRNFEWTTAFNFTFNKNEVTSLGGPDFVYTGWVGGGNLSSHGANTTRLEIGHSVGSFYGRIYEGIWHSQEEIDNVGTMVGAAPGTIRWKDLNSDGHIDDKDEQFLGTGLPKLNFGMTNDFRFKGWDLHVFMYGVSGNKILNIPKTQWLYNANGLGAERITGRWNINRKDGYLPGNGTMRYENDAIVEDGSFLRLANINLSYDFPIKKGVVQKAAIGISVDNLAIISGYSGYDPEVNSGGLDNEVKGVDMYMYPSSRTFSFSLKIGF